MRLLLCLVLAACGADAPKVLRLATTTSTRDSGLLEFLLPPFEKRENVEVQVVAVGTGQALELGARGDADLVLVHARKLEDEFVAAGKGEGRRDVMYNDFVVLGPAADPAGARGKDVVEAFRRIAAARAPFVSRGDKSGTHIRELEIWAKAGGVPKGEAYLDAGQGMGPCIVMAAEKGAYVLADRGTWLSMKRPELLVLVEGDKALHNPYGAIVPTHAKADGAVGRKLLEYLTSTEGQRRIGEFRVGGGQLFHPVGEGQ